MMRVFVAAVANNTLEVVDLTGGKVIKSLAGIQGDSGRAVPRR
jgi:hypothetical protein